MVLSVLFKRDDNLTFIGSGFVTNKKGLGISAAHNFKNHRDEFENFRIAFPSLVNPSNLYKIKILHFEYFDPINATGDDVRKRRLPFYQDLVIFRICSFKYDDFYKIQRNRPDLTDRLLVKGFHNPTHVNFQYINNQVDLSALSTEDISLRIKHRLFSIFSSSEGDYGINPDMVELEKKYNNCMTLHLTAQKGVSGGPVLNTRNKVIGIYLGGKQHLHYSNILCSKYIRKKYKSMLI